MTTIYGLKLVKNLTIKIYGTAYKSLLLLTFGLVLLSFAYLISGSASAQITPTSRAVINPEDKTIPLGPHIYMTKDPDHKLTYNVIVNRHQNNTRGMRQDEEILNLGASQSPVWMVFSVLNNSEQQDWVLDFGSTSAGRLAMVHKILVHNHTTGQTFSRALKQSGKIDIPPEGTAIPVKILQGQINLFIVFVEAEGGLPALITPKLVSPDYYLNKPGEMLSLFGVIVTLLLLITGSFIVLSLLKKNVMYCIFAGYFATALGLYGFIHGTFYAAHPLLNDIITFGFGLLTLLGLVGNGYFLNLKKEDIPDLRILMVSGGAIALLTLLNIIIWSSSNITGVGFLFFSGLIIQALLAYLAISQTQYSKLYAAPYALGCITAVIAGLVTIGAAGGFIATTPLTLHAFWGGVIVQGMLFIGAAIAKIKTEEEEERQKQLREMQEIEATARLKQSKEAADQSRLLRVIERERELMAELREREMQRTEEMRRAKEQADEANRAKSAFLAVVSHEIRTPMTGLMGMIRLLLESKMTPQQHDYMLAMQKSGDTMMALLNDILDFEKIESGNMELENVTFDLPRLVQGVVTLMSAHAGEKDLYLKADIKKDSPQFVKGDPTRLRQVLLNLVNNALKFTQKGGVTIHLKAATVENLPAEIRGDYEVYFGVEDTGIGISPEAQEKLFAPFSQADSSISRKFGGTGLGLTICKRLVEAMGGTIGLDSKEDAGTTFSFSLLMEKGAQGESKKEAAEESHTDTDNEKSTRIPSRHILIVEDNEMNRKVLEGFLSKMGHKIAQSESAEDALKRCEKEKFDLIFMDINMEGMSGVEAARKLRTMPAPANAIPIIALTGNVRSEDVQTYFKANINGFLAKPIDPEKLEIVIANAYKNVFDNPVVTGESAPYESETVITAGPPPEQEKDSKASTAVDEEEEALFDWDMLQSLLESLGSGQLHNLLEGFLDKAKELVESLEKAVEKNDHNALVGRSHELKGMAANFGMSGVSIIAARIEHTASTGEFKKAYEEVSKLPGTFRTSEKKLSDWLAQNSK